MTKKIAKNKVSQSENASKEGRKTASNLKGQIQRPRRNRKSSAIREMVSESNLRVENLIYPIFVCEGTKKEIEIKAMPGQSRLSCDNLLKKIEFCLKNGITHFALFPQIRDDLKDGVGSEATNSKGLLAKIIRTVKSEFPDANLIADVALDPFTDHGHDGIVKGDVILNDETVDRLCEMAVQQAGWGADWVAPSDMMDGRVGAIREALDQNGFQMVSLLAYTAKYASGFYGPFRDALGSAPKFGDKKTYQMDYRNAREALREASLDEAEGADMMMVKPGLAYLDVLYRIRQQTQLPLAVYNVSGEYSMIKFAARQGVIDEKKCVLEMMYAFRRAGADAILTYFAPDVAIWLKQK